ncbi:MAG TPA: bifunctional YncE family protein/alkaline phosphatase family protein [Terriglobia bacterium]|nr:bifunctional YncE family protein/alkaline phosphatase family protein [Terriglobia bacterium]
MKFKQLLATALLQAGIALIAAGMMTTSARGQEGRLPARAVAKPGVVTTGQSITPAGAQSIFSGRVHAAMFGGSDNVIYAALASGLVYKLDWRRNKVLRVIHGGRNPGLQGMALDPTGDEPLMTGTITGSVDGKRQIAIQLVRISGAQMKVIAHRLGTFAVGQVSAASEKNAAGERRAGVALTFNDELAVIDLATGKVKGTVKTGIAPFGVRVDRAGTVAYVTNWGGRFPTAQDTTRTTGVRPGADRVVVDQRGIASTGTVSRVDLATMQVTHTIETGLHPTAMVWDEPRARLYVADSNSDTVTVIDTHTNRVAQTFKIDPFQKKAEGVAPNALAVSADGKTLYVACGGINAVAVMRADDGKIEGLIPTAWYPNDLRLSGNGQYLLVANLMGVGPGGDAFDIERMARMEGLDILPGPTRRYVHSDRSSVEVVRVPDAAQLEGYSKAVAHNNHLALANSEAPAAAAAERADVKPLPVPLRAGDPSLIHHVVFIIKENRSYDQVFGDMSQGNSDPTLVQYGPDVTPNQHRLAEQFVLLDNFYASGGNSADGHQWLTQAAETDYTYWPGYDGRSYPYDGADPIAPASSGFIWNEAKAHRISVADFGEYVPVPRGEMSIRERAKNLAAWKAGENFKGRFHEQAPTPSFNKIVVHDFPYWTLAVPDVARAQIFIQYLKQWEQSGDMPSLVMMQLPSDHTAGTRPGVSTPKAMVADNDWALGQVVAALTHSRFWKDMAIFVVEDDAQNGIDHVDGHRTVALAISPYTRRGAVDSTYYSHVSMVKTIERMLGLPTMSIFDLISDDMRNCFQSTADDAPYAAVEPEQSIYQVNPSLEAVRGARRKAAVESMKMDFDVPDDVPSQRLNRILWHDARGWQIAYPQARQGAFAPAAANLQENKMASQGR